jgi:CubicO group peptidase (beta-lactamase class C family)
LPAQETLEKKLKGLDKRVEKIMADWKVSGCAVGIVQGGKLVYAKGFGYSDVESRQVITSNTLFPIGSNTKLFTALAAGKLVSEGVLEWDMPIKRLVPQIQFYNENLNASITLRDMLSHRTGISRHDLIWYGADLSRKELFEKLKYLKPAAGLRETFLYNNMMYVAVGNIIELKTGITWEQYMQEHIFVPLDMTSTVFTIEEMEKAPDFARPYHSNFFEDTLEPVEFYRKMQGVGPGGSIISNIDNLANWVLFLLAEGAYKNKQILPATVLKETMIPATIVRDYYPFEEREFSHALYGLGRDIVTYKGHLMTEHGGGINGFSSQITLFPHDDLGIIILTNSTGQLLSRFLQFEIADRMLGLNRTLWHERKLEMAQNEREKRKIANERIPLGHVPGTMPSHQLGDFVGEYEDPAFGKIEVIYEGDQLFFQRNAHLFPLLHVHYDHFESTDELLSVTYKLSFLTNSHGDIDKVLIPMEEIDVTFKRVTEKNLKTRH